MSTRSRTAAAPLVLSLFVPLAALADVPHLVGYQGRLLRADGTAATGTASVTFSLFAADSGGTALWFETQTLGLSDGYYSTFLGLVTAAPDGLFDGARWLEVKVGSETLTPRQQIGAAPYALTAQRVVGSADLASLRVAGQTVVDGSGRLAGAARYGAGTGIVIDDASQTISLRACPSGQILLREDLTWQCATRVAEVTAAAPLSVTNGSSTPQLSMTQAGTGVSGFLSSTDWTSFTAKYGATTQCGGDLSGSLAAPVVTRLQSRSVSSNLPGSGQVLKWTAATSQWEPSADSDSGGTVTSVTVDAPLTAYNGATAPHISMAAATGTVDGYLSSTDWTRFDAKYEASTQCVGDLFGTLGNPVVAKLRGVSVATTVPTAAQVLRFDGNAWTPATLATSDVSGLAGDLSNLNASNLVSGWVPDGRLASTYAQPVAFTSASNSFAGSGAGLVGLDATNIATGALADGRLASAYSQAVSFTNASNAFAGSGSGLTALNAGNLTTGTVADGRLASSYAQAVSFTNASNSFTGNGSGLTALNAGNLTTGAVADGRLASSYSQAISFTNASNSFAGIGSGLTALNADALSSGTLPDARLSGTYSGTLALSSTSNTLAGTFTGTATGGAVFTQEVRLPVAGTCASGHGGALIFDGTHFKGCDGSKWITLDNVPPVVGTITPSVGSTGGGTAVTIVGSGFQSNAKVIIGGVEATSVVVASSATSITCNTPASGSTGAKDVVVQNPDFQAGTLYNGFNYHVPPTVSSVSPAVGPTTGNVVVTVNGTGFAATPTSVTFKGNACTGIAFVDSTRLTSTIPAATAGVASVVVTNPDGIAGSANAFTYETPGSSANSALASCAALKAAGVTSNGTYWIDPDGAGGASAYQVYCDHTDCGGVTSTLPTFFAVSSLYYFYDFKQSQTCDYKNHQTLSIAAAKFNASYGLNINGLGSGGTSFPYTAGNTIVMRARRDFAPSTSVYGFLFATTSSSGNDDGISMYGDRIGSRTHSSCCTYNLYGTAVTNILPSVNTSAPFGMRFTGARVTFYSATQRFDPASLGPGSSYDSMGIGGWWLGQPATPYDPFTGGNFYIDRLALFNTQLNDADTQAYVAAMGAY